MRRIISLAALAALLLSFQGPEVPVRGRRDLRIRVPVEGDVEAVQRVTLWISRDAGVAWAPAGESDYRWEMDGDECVVSYRAPADGDYSFYVQLGDDVSNTMPDPDATTEPAVRALIDTEAPTVQCLTPMESAVRMGNGPFRVYFVARDAGGIEAVRLFVSADDGASWSPVGAPPGEDARGGYFDFAPPAAGIYHLIVQARDRAGHVAPAAETDLRSRAPHVVLTVRPAVEVRVAGGDVRATPDGTARVRYEIDGPPDAAVGVYLTSDNGRTWNRVRDARAGADDTGPFVEFPVPPGGEFGVALSATLEGREYDAPRDGSAPAARVASAPDLAPPMVEILSPREVTRRDADYRLYFLATDDREVAALHLFVSPDGGRTWWQSPAAAARDEQGWNFAFVAPREGTYQLIVQAVDASGNVRPAPADQLAGTPADAILTIVPPPAARWVGPSEVRAPGGTVRIGYAIENAEVGEPRVYLTADGGATWIPVSNARLGSENGGLTVEFPIVAPGTYGAALALVTDGREWGTPQPGTPPTGTIVVTPPEGPAPAARWVGPREIRASGGAVRIRYALENVDVGEPRVYVTSNAGATWMPVSSARLGLDDESLYIEFEIVAPGTYGAALALFSNGREWGTPEAGTAPSGTIVVTAPEVVTPQVTQEPPPPAEREPEVHWIGARTVTASGGRTRVRYLLTDGEGAEIRAYVTADAGATWFRLPTLGAGSDDLGDYVEFVIVAPGTYGVTLAASQDGREWGAPASGDEAQGTAIVPAPPGVATPGVAAVAWLSPKPGDELRVGQSVVLRWQAETAGDVTVEYRRGEAEWQAIHVGADPYGMFVWAIPGPATESLEFRVRSATGEEAGSGAIATRPTVRAAIPEARSAFERGLVEFHRQQYGAAAAHFRHALELWGEYPEALTHLGLVYLEMAEPGRALDYFLRAKADCPSDPEAYYNVGYAMAQLGLHEEALRELTDAADLGGERTEDLNAQMLELLGAVARRADEAGNVDLAVRASRLFLRLPPLDVPYRPWVQRYVASH